MAEIHGCGTDAKRSARADFKEQVHTLSFCHYFHVHFLSIINFVCVQAALQGRSTYVDPNKRAQLHRKLEKQVSDSQSFSYFQMMFLWFSGSDRWKGLWSSSQEGREEEIISVQYNFHDNSVGFIWEHTELKGSIYSAFW